jgi:hypothetical protein
MIFPLNESGSTMLSTNACGPIGSGGMPAYLICTVFYVDVYDRPHKTTACLKYHPITRKLSSQYQLGDMT